MLCGVCFSVSDNEVIVKCVEVCGVVREAVIIQTFLAPPETAVPSDLRHAPHAVSVIPLHVPRILPPLAAYSPRKASQHRDQLMI